MNQEIYKTIQMHHTNSKLILKDIQIWGWNSCYNTYINCWHKILILVVIWNVRRGESPATAGSPRLCQEIHLDTVMSNVVAQPSLRYQDIMLNNDI